MSATIVGSPSATATATNAKVLRRQEYQKDINGLETLVETYLVQSQNLLTIIPTKDTTHQAFSSATTKYSRMAVESFSASEQDGNITELNITFVGLTSSSGLPPAVVRIIPVENAGIFGPPINIEAQFLSDSNENDFLRGKISTTSPILTVAAGSYASYKFRIPTFINGTEMPKNPREPYFKSYSGGFFGAGLATSFPQVSADRYDGYVNNSTQFEKRGQFLTARLTFQEYRFTFG